jgi:vacuolar-type H+-ATPase subunit I/STV1
MTKVNGGTTDVRAADPAIPPAEIARTRAQQLVGNITSAAIERLGHMRDQLDDLMRAVRGRDEKIVEIIAEHAAFADQAVKTCSIVGETLVKLRAEMLDSEPKLQLGPTVTQQRTATE